ncbi:isochorismatase family protein [Chryseobacterium sp. T1]
MKRNDFLKTFGLAGILPLFPLSLFGADKTTPDDISSTKKQDDMTDKYVTFKHSDSVILMVDYQDGIAKTSPSYPLDDLKANTLKLMALAKVFNMPIIFTSSEETEARKGMLFSYFEKIFPTEYANRIKRNGVVDAFSDPAFAEAVKKTKRKNIVIGGVSTEECVSLPAMSALGLGYNCKVIADCCSSHSAYTDTIQFNKMLHYGVDITTIRQFVADMVVSWATPEAKQANQLPAQWQSLITN